MTEAIKQTGGHLALARDITQRYPQMISKVDRATIPLTDDLDYITPPLPPGIEMSEDKELGYVIAGSLASVLIADADTIGIQNDSGKYTDIPVSDEFKKSATTFSRSIGDFDYIAVHPDYSKRNQEIWAYLGSSTSKYLGSGGGYIQLNELSNAAKEVIRDNEASSLEADPLDEEAPLGVARLIIDDEQYYIVEPRSMVAYKVLNAMESYKHSKEPKKDKFNRDIQNLISMARDLYGEKYYIGVIADELHSVMAHQAREYERVYSLYPDKYKDPHKAALVKISEMAEHLYSDTSVQEGYKELIVAWQEVEQSEDAPIPVQLDVQT